MRGSISARGLETASGAACRGVLKRVRWRETDHRSHPKHIPLFIAYHHTYLNIPDDGRNATAHTATSLCAPNACRPPGASAAVISGEVLSKRVLMCVPFRFQTTEDKNKWQTCTDEVQIYASQKLFIAKINMVSTKM